MRRSLYLHVVPFALAIIGVLADSSLSPSRITPNAPVCPLNEASVLSAASNDGCGCGQDFVLSPYKTEGGRLTAMAGGEEGRTQLSDIEGIELEPIEGGQSFASETLWANQPTLIFVVRRLGCSLCRAHAKSISRQSSTIQGSLGVRLVAVTFQTLDAADFQAHYWPHELYLDKHKGFYKALGGGAVRQVSLWGMLTSPKFWGNVWATRGEDVKGNLDGEGLIMGGLYIVGRGKSGIQYEFVEKTPGDATDPNTLMQVCRDMVGPNASQRCPITDGAA